MNKKMIIALIIVIIIVAFSLIFVYYRTNFKTSTFAVLDETDKINDAKKYGDDVVGWLRVEGTNIDLPLIRADEDTELLRGDYDFAWTNSFPDGTGNRPAYISHNIRNVSRNPIVGDDTMTRFEQLMSFIYPSFVKENQFIEFTDSEGDTSLYRVYAVALLNDDQNASFSDTYTSSEQKRYIKKAMRESMYDIDVDVNEDDLMLTLFTCTRFYGADTSYSFRVDARKLRDGEDKVYAKVKSNKNYEKIKERMEESESGEENEKV